MFRRVEFSAANGRKGRNAYLISHKFSPMHASASKCSDDSRIGMRMSTAFLNPIALALSVFSQFLFCHSS